MSLLLLHQDAHLPLSDKGAEAYHWRDKHVLSSLVGLHDTAPAVVILCCDLGIDHAAATRYLRGQVCADWGSDSSGCLAPEP